jgi:hypothetical protein
MTSGNGTGDRQAARGPDRHPRHEAPDDAGDHRRAVASSSSSIVAIAASSSGV